MELEPKNDGRWQFSLGPVEKWVVAAVATGFLAMAFWLWRSVQTLLIQQALTNQKLADLGVQLAGVPDLTTRVARLELQVERNRQDIAETRAMKGLK